MHMRKLRLFLGGAMLAAAVAALSGCSNVQQHHVMVLKDYSGNVSFLDGPTWQYTGVTVTGTDYWDGRIWIDLPLDRSSEAKEVYQTADGALLVDMNVAFSRGKSAESARSGLSIPPMRLALSKRMSRVSRARSYTITPIRRSSMQSSRSRMPSCRFIHRSRQSLGKRSSMMSMALTRRAMRSGQEMSRRSKEQSRQTWIGSGTTYSTQRSLRDSFPWRRLLAGVHKWTRNTQILSER